MYNYNPGIFFKDIKAIHAALGNFVENPKIW